MGKKKLLPGLFWLHNSHHFKLFCRMTDYKIHWKWVEKYTFIFKRKWENMRLEGALWDLSPWEMSRELKKLDSETTGSGMFSMSSFSSSEHPPHALLCTKLLLVTSHRTGQLPPRNYASKWGKQAAILVIKNTSYNERKVKKKTCLNEFLIGYKIMLVKA